MTVERSVSTYNILYTKLRTSTSQKTLSDRLVIAWNGVPTAAYDPRPAVVSFLKKKNRRLLVKIKSSSEKVFKYFLMGNSPKSLEKGIKIQKWSSHEIVGFLSKLLSECQKCHLREPIIQKLSSGPCLRTPLG